jgi:PKD repeat protein
LSVAAIGPNPDNVAVFAAEAICRRRANDYRHSANFFQAPPQHINLANFPHNGSAQVWQLTAANTINHLSDVNFIGANFNSPCRPRASHCSYCPRRATTNSPVAAMSAQPSSGTAPLNVFFNASGSADPDGSIVSYGWNFGDSVTASGVTANHSYSAPGSYIARLTVTDNQGASNSITTTIQVNADLPGAPSNLAASAVSRSQINLSWSNNANSENGFKIERCAGATCTNFAQIASVGVNVTNFSNSGLKHNTAYRYRLRSYNVSGNSAYSNIAGAKTAK